MSVNLKKHINTILGPALREKGFSYDSSRSGVGGPGFVYSKGDPEPDIEWHEERKKGDITDIPKRDEIIISRNRFSPEITFYVRSLVKWNCVNIGYIAGFNTQKWWPASTVEETEKSLIEILSLLNEYAWNWFDQPESK